MSLMSKLTASYIAGYLDGEGYFGITKNRYNHKRKTKGYFYRAIIKATSIDPEIINWLQESFGGWKNKRKFEGNQKDAYTWEFCGTGLIPFIRKIVPYLKIKKEQAQTILKAQKLKEKAENKGARIGIIFPDGIKQELDTLYWKIRKLNHRGKLCTLRD
jgi:hypothetical protein